MNAPAAISRRHPAYARGALASLIALIVLALLWELWLAPVRPGAWALALKAVPLACALPGVARKSLYTMQWAAMLVLLYIAEGVVRGMTDAGLSASLGWLEVLLAAAFFGFALAYVAPFKRAAKLDARAKER
ncbi:DUF2069 domain-containing protein [Caballeronia sp. LZ043]|uniref:DUF2069 domain-containing protein n=1 Tax=Caballeronia sp. LZ043 TaxID=3038569 RepID=UPI00286209D5|nr:DUF2069 domain-containing protein [Caballeronia sp. LZ043]MDR5819887.1 DUF2069 domain-containing protein [Caballeronia sp. LZ043]